MECAVRLFCSWFLSLAAVALFAQPALAAPTPPTANDFARAPAISDVSVSPDGKHIVALVSPDGVSVIISVWRMDALSQKPTNIGATNGRFLEVQFLKNDRLLVTVVQPFDFPSDFEMANPRGHLIKHFVTDLDGKSFVPLISHTSIGHSSDVNAINAILDADVLDSLPRDPRNVLAEDDSVGGNGDVYKVDVYSMTAALVMHGSEKYGGYQADLKGEIRGRVKTDFDNGKIYIAQEIRDPETGVWSEHFRSYAKDRIITSIVAFTDDPNVVLISTVKGGDKTGIYEYDIKQRKILEPAFEHRLFEARDVVRSNAAADYGRVLGYTYAAETNKVYWLDGRMAAIAKALDRALGVNATSVDWVDPGTGLRSSIEVGAGVEISLGSQSDDGKYMIVEKSGPKQPPQYFLLTDGAKLTPLGKSRPKIDLNALGDTQLVEYPARDGLVIPAFLTTPPKTVFGPGPYPTLIEPHGGPWGRDDMEWDLPGWIQYFASRGYAVLQPQFRGSEDWGQKLWRAGDNEWGQKMADDNDDGVKWLIAQHIADPARVAIFGYSYGGYAALAASIRPNDLYQCAISGAGAGNLYEVADETYDNRFEREFQHPTIGGFDAASHAAEAKIPVFLYHGDRDQTVKVQDSRNFAAALRGSGKPYKYTEIKDMGHQFIFWTPPMGEQQLTEVDAFLKTGCKPGGL
jgi:dienelactone hydrolase